MKKRSVKCVLTVVFLLIFLGSGGFLAWKLADYWNGDRNYEKAAQIAQEEQPAEQNEESSPAQVNLAALQEVNHEVIGWLMIEGTEISYPLMQGSDNDYYLNHTWDGTRSAVGAIFLDCRNSSDLQDFNSVIYGHKMNNDSMFGLLHEYKNQGYWEAHPTLCLTTSSGVFRYDIFAYYETGTISTYSRDFVDDQTKQAYIDECLTQAMTDTGIRPEVDDHILTLSTCTGNGHATRWVVQAVHRE
ncbi:MAG: class B sortase [Ruminiclostridium sp.]|nr:class B sortase [Ruminiclostridium sp.]